MNGLEHFHEAESLIGRAAEHADRQRAQEILAYAQVHAILALAWYTWLRRSEAE